MGMRSALRSLIYGPPDFAAKASGAASPSIPFPGGGDARSGQFGSWDALLPSTRIDYAREAGDSTQSAVVMACVLWMARTFPEAPIQVKRRMGAQLEVVPAHPLTALLARPNPYYSGILLWHATLTSFQVAGNAYWLKVRSRRGDVVELWYEPHYTIAPEWPNDGSQFLSGYRINRGGTWYRVAVDDVVHFRYGIDPGNPRVGLSPLASAFREIFTDNEAANFSASLLRNMGVPGMLVSPALPGDTIDDPAGLKRDIIAKTTGDRRGEPMVMALPVKMERMAFSPADMAVREQRRIPEERISGLLGIPAIVAGLGAGLDRATYSNMQEARESAYESCIVPMQRLLANELDAQLLPDLGDAAAESVAFDLSQVRALQEDRDKLVARNVAGFKGGVLRRAEARRALGLETDPEDEIFINDLITIGARITEADPAGTLESGDRDLGRDPAGRDTGRLLPAPK